MNKTLTVLFLMLCAFAFAMAATSCSNPFAAKPPSPVDLHAEAMRSPEGAAMRAQQTNNFWK